MVFEKATRFTSDGIGSLIKLISKKPIFCLSLELVEM